MHCNTEQFTVGRILVERNGINENPPYQRQSAVWSLDKQQLFIDSLFNDFDIPKLYLHDLRGKHGRYQYAIIDGKQRLQTLWRFLDDDFRLGTAFDIFDPPKGRKPLPEPGDSFAKLSDEWKELFKAKHLDVVLVHDATEDDIEELFSRLNNGEALNAAEKRNAMGGDMCELIRQISKHRFFTGYASFSNSRFQHLEAAAKLLLIQKTEEVGKDIFCDLKKKFLDGLVDENKKMSGAKKARLRKKVQEQLDILTRIFTQKDPILAKQASLPLYYLFSKVLFAHYAHPNLYTKMHHFLERFQAARQQNLGKAEEQRDQVMLDFDRLNQQGTNDRTSLQTRVSILLRYFLQQNPDVSFRDPKRAFSEEERIAIWILGHKRCATCKRLLPQLSDMEADHAIQWAHGGATKIRNSRALCGPCNAKLAKRVA